jgi:hypothetical protein
VTLRDRHVEEFVSEARRFCNWALQPAEANRTAAKALVALASPDVDEPPEIDIGTETARMRTTFAKLPLRYYSDQFDPLTVPPNEPAVAGDLANDLAEVFEDVRKGLLLFEQGT